MGAELVPKTEDLRILTRLSAQENFIEFCHCHSFKTYMSRDMFLALVHQHHTWSVLQLDCDKIPSMVTSSASSVIIFKNFVQGVKSYTKLLFLPVTFASLNSFSNLYSPINVHEKWSCFHIVVSRLIVYYRLMPQHTYVSQSVNTYFRIGHSYLVNKIFYRKFNAVCLLYSVCVTEIIFQVRLAQIHCFHQHVQGAYKLSEDFAKPCFHKY